MSETTQGQVEQALLAAMLHDFEQLRIHEAFAVLTPDDFEFPGHGYLFDTLRTLVQAGHRVTPLSAAEHLRRRGQLGEFISQEYIERLENQEEPCEMIAAYAELVRDAAVMRALRSAGMAIQHEINRFESPEEAIAFAQGELIRVTERGGRVKPFHTAEEVVDATLAEIEHRRENPTAAGGLTTGFTRLDLMTGGLPKQLLWYVGARPSMGKTSFLMNMIEHVAVQKNQPVMLFSLEMRKEAVMKKLIASMAEVDHRDLQTGRITPEQQQRMDRCRDRIAAAPLFINDQPVMSPGRMKLAVQQVMMRHDCRIELVGIDYLQLLSTDRTIGKGDNLNLNMTDISNKLKRMARSMDLVVACLSQLNRTLESRQDKKPVLSDLRDSGSIEQDADLVTFLYRDEYYYPDTKRPGVADVIVAKQREGETGIFELSWDHRKTKFRNPYAPGSTLTTAYGRELPPL